MCWRSNLEGGHISQTKTRGLHFSSEAAQAMRSTSCHGSWRCAIPVPTWSISDSWCFHGCRPKLWPIHLTLYKPVGGSGKKLGAHIEFESGSSNNAANSWGKPEFTWLSQAFIDIVDCTTNIPFITSVLRSKLGGWLSAGNRRWLTNSGDGLQIWRIL